MNLKITNKNWILLSTAILIGIAYGVYFLVYVKNQEKTIVSNNFRILQQVVQNIKALEDSYHKNAIIKSKSIRSNEVNQQLSPLSDDQCIKMSALDTQLEKGIIYGPDGLYFEVDYIMRDRKYGCNYYFTDYDVFFSNDLFQRKDVFDQIIITEVNEGEGRMVKDRRILFSNLPLGIMDSTFHSNTLRNARDEITINDTRFVSFNQKIEGESNIYISGLVLKSKFDQQKRSVSPFIVFTLSTALILIILAMPLLKLKIMSSEERLYIRDVIFSVISVYIGPAVFMVFLYTSLTFFGSEKMKLHESLQSLSSRVEHNFQSELQRLVNQIDDINVMFPAVKDDSRLVGNTFELAGESKLPDSFSEFTRDTSNSNDIQGYRVFENVIQREYIDFKHLKAAFWSDDRARGLVVLSAFNQPSYAQNLKHRKYLTNILNHIPSMFKDLTGKTHEISVESIKSVNDGSYEVGVGKSTSGAVLPVMAISAKLASVMDPILEDGYGFCILDKEGNTMFHSDIKKNMNENFISETKGVFRHTMASHAEIFKTVNYNGKSKTIYFRPMNCLSDHYIAAFASADVYYGPFTLSMISSFVLFLCYLLLLLLVYFVIYYSTYRHTKLKQAIYMLNFLRPYETQFHFNIYKRLILVSSLVIIYLIISSLVNRSHYDFLISDLIVVSVSLLIFSFYLLSKHQPHHQIIHTSFKYPSEKGFRVTMWIIVIGLVFRIVFLIFSAASFGVVINAVAGFFVMTVIFSELYFEKSFFKFEFLKSSTSRTDQLQSIYKIYLFLWVVILSIIPINLFLRITYEKENSILDKYRGLELLSKLSQWKSINYNEFADKFENDMHYERFVTSMKENDVHLAFDKQIANLADPSEGFQGKGNSNPYFNAIYVEIRPNYNERTALTSNYVLDNAADSSWIFMETANTNTFTMRSNFGQHFAYNQIIREKVNFFRQNWLYILVITLISVAILIRFLNFTLGRIYGFAYKNYGNRPDKVTGRSFSTYFLNPDFFSNNSSYNNIFIVGINASNTSYIKNHLYEHYNDKFFILDFYDFDEKSTEASDQSSSNIFDVLKMDRLKADWKKIKEYFDQPEEQIYVLIEHFEFGYNDVRMNKLKLEALKYLVDCENFKVLISSEINATKLLDYYEDSIKMLNRLLSRSNVDDRIVLQEKMDDLKVDFKKWQHLFGSFVKCIIPINRFPNDEELAHGEYLDMINNYLGNRKELEIWEDDKILTVQQMSYPYYFSVWNSLSKDERYIVYDIARDGFVNTINTNGIMSLLDKGILVYDHSLRIMNESFANFVLTKVNSDEALEMEMESRKKGTWNTTFAVMFLLIISLVIFLSIGQQNFLNDLNAFLTAIAALIGLLIRFSGFFSFGGNRVSGP